MIKSAIKEHDRTNKFNTGNTGGNLEVKKYHFEGASKDEPLTITFDKPVKAILSVSGHYKAIWGVYALDTVGEVYTDCPILKTEVATTSFVTISDVKKITVADDMSSITFTNVFLKNELGGQSGYDITVIE